jgi:hypothetical protein
MVDHPKKIPGDIETDDRLGERPDGIEGREREGGLTKGQINRLIQAAEARMRFLLGDALSDPLGTKKRKGRQ